MKRKTSSLFTLSICSALFISCLGGNKPKSEQKSHASIDHLTIDSVQFPDSEVLTLKSYYLSCFHQKGASEWLYAYNYKQHGLDCFDLHSKQVTQIPLCSEGPSTVVRPISGMYISSPDSIWLYDAAQKVLLINSKGKVMKSISLSSNLPSGQSVMIDRNYAISSTNLYYDAVHRSLLFGIKDASGSSVSFKVREFFLDTQKCVEILLPSSTEIPNVGDGDYANMNKPNLTFTADKIICNYPVESNIYVVSRASGKFEIFNAPSSYTTNKAKPCSSREDYAQWERHGIENTHFYELMYLPSTDKYVRLHLGAQEYDQTKDISTLLSRRRLYLTLFDKNFSVLGEQELPFGRYSFFTGWCPTEDALLLFVDHPLLGEKQTENLTFDRVKW